MIRVSTTIIVAATITYYGCLVLMLNLEIPWIKIYGIMGASLHYIILMMLAIYSRHQGLDEVAREYVRWENEQKEREKNKKK